MSARAKFTAASRLTPHLPSAHTAAHRFGEISIHRLTAAWRQERNIMPTGPINIFEYEALAKETLPPAEYDFIAGGATDEITLRRTRAAFESIMLRPRMLVDISQPDLSTTVLGQPIAFPVLVDPAGHHSRAHPEGELATVRAAGAMETVLLLSSGSSYRLEEV